MGGREAMLAGDNEPEKVKKYQILLKLKYQLFLKLLSLELF